ncbi:MAG TPA: hypothetical protein VL793_16055, partial [Patescibacteria group bacterium]|nr:hypothetical protein [Patescibacteria group bacterium]
MTVNKEDGRDEFLFSRIGYGRRAAGVAAEAPQRLSGVTAWANALANSSNLPFIVFPSVVVLDYGLCGEILIPLG